MNRNIKLILSVLFVIILLMPVNRVALQEKSTVSDDSISTGDTVTVQPDTLLYTRPNYIYNPSGKKDPFISLAPKETGEEVNVIKGLFIYENSRILGIVNAEEDLYALVMDGNKASYILREGDRVFGGYVSQITDDAIYLYIVKYGRSMTIILRLESSKLTAIEEIDGEISVKAPGINISYEKGAPATEKSIIEDVFVPSPDTKTIEEEWFGRKDGIQNLLNEESTVDKPEESSSFYLIDPQADTWISLPYLLRWTKTTEKDVSFTIVIDDNSDFESPIFIKEGINTTSYLLDDNMGLSPNKELFWKIIAVEPSGKLFSSKQTDMSFKIIGQK